MRKRKDENQHRAGAWPDAHRKNDSGDLTPRHGACDVARIDDVIAGFAKAMIVAMVMAVMVMVVGVRPLPWRPPPPQPNDLVDEQIQADERDERVARALQLVHPGGDLKPRGVERHEEDAD